jgi:hypothetical protein
MRSIVGSFDSGIRARARVLTVAALAALSVVAPFTGVAHADYTVKTKFASNTGWGVYNADPATGGATLLGAAELVCLNASAPAPCPSGAIQYGYPGAGWSADLSSISGASWIWAPGVTGSTAPAELQQFYFSKTFSLRGEPDAGYIALAADDFAEVRVNGSIVGSTGSLTNPTTASSSQQALTRFDLTPFLVQGTNVVTVRAQNGPGWFAACTGCTYRQNPAGVVFGGGLTFTVAGPSGQ